MPINWYLQAELRLLTTDWAGMTQNFVTTFLFESEHPTVDQALQIIRQKVFEGVTTPPMMQTEDEEILTSEPGIVIMLTPKKMMTPET